MSPKMTGPETRSRLMDAAADCFARSGFDATGVAEICTTAGVSKGAFYHHFPSKQAVFLALLDRWLALLDDQLLQVSHNSGNAAEAMVNIAGLSRLVFQSARGQLPMFLEFWNQSAHDPVVWQTTIAPYQRYREFFGLLVETGIAEGSFRREEDPKVGGPVLVALAVGVLLQGLMDPEGADWTAVLEHGVDLLIRGMRTEA